MVTPSNGGIMADILHRLMARLPWVREHDRMKCENATFLARSEVERRDIAVKLNEIQLAVQNERRLHQRGGKPPAAQ
jgi:hypothetical protein